MCRYLKRAADITEGFDVNQYSPSDFDKFCDIIGEDGVMVLKLTSANSSELVVRDVVCNMLAQTAAKRTEHAMGLVTTYPIATEALGSVGVKAE